MYINNSYSNYLTIAVYAKIYPTIREGEGLMSKGLKLNLD